MHSTTRFDCPPADVYRSVFLILSLASLSPQLWRCWTQRSSSGISLFYVLFNLVVTTELFTFSFFWVVNSRLQRPDNFVHDPHNAGDIINLLQFALIWVLWLLMCAQRPHTLKHLLTTSHPLPTSFAACLTYPPNSDNNHNPTPR